METINFNVSSDIEKFVPALVIANVRICGLSQAIGFRRSFNSQNKADSKIVFTSEFCDKSCKTVEEVVLGESDLNRLRALVKSGDSHAKTNRMIDVYMDITMPRRMWVDFDTYRLGRKECISETDIETMSDSTMHTLKNRLVTKQDFSNLVDQRVIDVVNEKIADYKKGEENKVSGDTLNLLLTAIKDNLPESFLQTRSMKINYQALRHIKLDRYAHKQFEFREFCKFIDSLPFSKFLIDPEEHQINKI